MHCRSFLYLASISLLLLGGATPALALITGSESDEPIERPDWPSGAAEIFNIPERIAYWEGPPFGGGQFHCECRGDTDALNEVLAKFAQLESANKRIVVEEGAAQSFWLNLNNEADKRELAHIDWKFVVWCQGSWDQLKNLPAEINPTSPDDREKGPPVEITIYTGGNIVWDKVKLPEGVTVVDNRMAAHGYDSKDGYVLEGTLTEAESGEAIAGTVSLETIEPQKTGGYKHTLALTVAPDATGKWVLKNVPAGWYRVVAKGDDYVSRIVGHVKPDGQPRWREFACTLAKAGEVAGRVTTASGEPLKDVQVRLSDVTIAHAERYDSAEELKTTTDESGLYRFANVPIGGARIMIHKDGFCLPGLGPEILVPSESVDLKMLASSNVTVSVLFQTTSVPKQYLVEIEPEEGNKVGSWGGSATIDAQSQHVFENVPPGRYKIWGHPNPSSMNEQSKPEILDLKGGETIVKTIIVTD